MVHSYHRLTKMTEEKARWNNYQRKRFWLQKYEKIIGEKPPKICPLAIEDDRPPIVYKEIDGITIERNIAKRCPAYNRILDCTCWVDTPPGRCACPEDYTPCDIFRLWLHQQEARK